MNKNIEENLDKYSKIQFSNDLERLNIDVKNRMIAKRSPFSLSVFSEKIFGMPIFLSGSALASTLIVGIIMGAQLQTNSGLVHPTASGLEVFSPTNAYLPSSILDPLT